MDFRSILFIMCIFLPAAVVSQDENDKQVGKDYRAFQEILNKEIYESDNKPERPARTIIQPAVLPSWFIHFPASDKHTIYALGISDPGMEKEAAIELAGLRAKSLLALLFHSELSLISDHFTSENSSESTPEFITKYSNFYQVEASMMFDSNRFTIEEVEVNLFHEAIVLASYSMGGTGKDSVKTTAHVFLLERQKQNLFELEEKYEVNSIVKFRGEESTYSYALHSLNNIFEITSEFNQQPLPFAYYNYGYSVEGNSSDEAIDPNFSSKLKYGLWKSFMEVFLQELYFISQNPEIFIRQVGDNHSSGTKNLSRETSQLLHSVKIDKIQVDNNRICLQLGILK